MTLPIPAVWEGFGDSFEKTLPQVVTAPYFVECHPLTKANDLSIEVAGITNLTPVGSLAGGVGVAMWPKHCSPLIMACQLKPCFCLFQRVRDQLYLQPPTMLEKSSSTKAYFGALSFTKPLEKLVLRTVSLSILLD